MDWSSIATSFIASGATVAVAYITIRPELRKTSRAAETASAAAVKTEASINNRPSPASDRWDAIHSDVSKLGRDMQKLGLSMEDLTHAQLATQEDVAIMRSEAHVTHREISALRAADNLIREDSLRIRSDLTDHISATQEYLPLIEDLHAQYITGDNDGENTERTDTARPAHAGRRVSIQRRRG